MTALNRALGATQADSVSGLAASQQSAWYSEDLGKAIQKLAEWHQTPLLRYGNVPAPLLAQWQEVAR